MSNKNQEEKAVVQAVRDISDKNNSGLVTLSTGVVIRAKRVPNMIFMDITKRFSEPSVPTFFNEDTGRDEENPSDPAYIERYQEYQANLSVAIVNAMLLLGTEYVSSPKNIYSPERKEWRNKLKILGIDSGDDEDLAYLHWIKYYVAVGDKDITDLVNAVGRLTGVSEDDVKDAVDQFRSRS